MLHLAVMAQGIAISVQRLPGLAMAQLDKRLHWLRNRRRQGQPRFHDAWRDLLDWRRVLWCGNVFDSRQRCICHLDCEPHGNKPRSRF